MGRESDRATSEGARGHDVRSDEARLTRNGARLLWGLELCANADPAHGPPLEQQQSEREQRNDKVQSHETRVPDDPAVSAQLSTHCPSR